MIDSDTEEQIAKAIEDKATYHGRRHNTTMYTNRRVKVADLPLIANHFLSQKGKRLVRSKTTVWNRSEPRRKNSRQAKLHLGKGYFCTRNPPKQSLRKMKVPIISERTSTMSKCFFSPIKWPETESTVFAAQSMTRHTFALAQVKP